MKIAKNSSSTVPEILGYITVFFLLLAALFGGQIMTFIFGQLGPETAGITDSSIAVTNETDAWLNGTTYTVANSGAEGFSGLVITSAINTTDNSSIAIENFTVSGSGFTNASVTTWPSIWVSYTYSYYGSIKSVSLSVQNESLQSVNAYAEGSSNQMNILSIAIILILLVGVFLLFWNRFIKGNVKGKTGTMDFGA